MYYAVEHMEDYSASQLLGASMRLDRFLHDVRKAGNLSQLFAVHFEAELYGLLNGNIGPDPYGMFRYDPDGGTHLDTAFVYLGNVNGIWTHTLAGIEGQRKAGRADKAVYESDMAQYRGILESNFRYMRDEFFRASLEARKQRSNPLRVLFGKAGYPKDPKGASADPLYAFHDSIGVYPSDLDGHHVPSDRERMRKITIPTRECPERWAVRMEGPKLRRRSRGHRI